ncbi:MAG: hydrogen peroxide-inducible genes activator [Bdellovibrionales bacterium]|nr:hydrogen peroxide-inducible genes activator [Bdellovibrionales bacterium]
MVSKLNFSLTQLEYVMAVHKYGHFAKAAEACGVTQPTLSMQIQKLEGEFEVALFDRSKKPILLTEAGKRLIDQIQTILFEARRMNEMIQAGNKLKNQGLLLLGIIPTIAPYLLPRLLPVIDRNFPHLRLKIVEMQTQPIVEALEKDEIDVGLLATPLNLAQIYEYPLFYEPFFAFCQKGHPLSGRKKLKYSELKYDDIWLLTEGHCLRHQVLDVCALEEEKRLKKKFQFESGSLETLKSLVDSSGGYTLLPMLATVNGMGARTQLIPFERPIPAREVGLVYRRKQHKVDLIESLGEAVLSSLPESLRKIRQKDLDILPIDS